jgi:hypothetical protein
MDDLQAVNSQEAKLPVSSAMDENEKIKDSERLPIRDPIKVLRYRTIKKNNVLGWWSAVALVEDHGKQQVCFYRWRKRDKEWKRDKKISFRSKTEWDVIRDAIEVYIINLEVVSSPQSANKPGTK